MVIIHYNFPAIAIQAFSLLHENMKPKALFEIIDIFQIPSVGCVVAGKLKNGTIIKGSKTIVNGRGTTILGIESFKKDLEILEPDIPAGLLLSGITKDEIQEKELYFE